MDCAVASGGANTELMPMRLLRPVAFGLAAATCLAAPQALAASLLVPHRAVYDLNLDKASDRSGITSISGRMVYEFNGSPCDGYTVTFRFVTQIDTQEVSRVTDQQTTTFEDGDGSSFSFVTKSFVDQSLDKEVKGVARLDDSATSVEIEKPEAGSIKLEHSQFPTQHLIELIDKAKDGESFYETNLFDGSDDADQIMTTTVIIGKPDAAASNDPELQALGALKPDRFWPVSIAYFEGDGEQEGGEEIPVYSISFKLHDNGVTRDLIMDYGDFSMKGTLVNLSLFDQQNGSADCGRE
jgi:hypothetical protein